MDISLILSLTGLALIDSTSIGTLFIPIWLLLAPTTISSRLILIYLITVAVFYFIVGVVLMLGAAPALDWLGSMIESPAGAWVQLLFGIALFSVSFRFDSRRSERLGKPDRAARWRDRALSHSSSTQFLMTLALIAAMAEVATMLPYLAAMAIIGTSELASLTAIGLLAAYCLVMITPAIALMMARNISFSLVLPLLQRMDAWVSRNGETAVGWIIGIAGFIVATNALGRIIG